MIDQISTNAALIFYFVVFSASIYSVFSQFVIRKYGKRERAKEIQKEVKELNKRYQEAIKSGDEKRMKKAGKDHSRIWELQSELMKNQLKPMLIIIPVVFIWSDFVRNLFPAFAIIVPFDLPIPNFPAFFSFDFANLFNMRHIFGGYGFFWVCVVFINILAQILVWAYNKARGTKS